MILAPQRARQLCAIARKEAKARGLRGKAMREARNRIIADTLTLIERRLQGR